MIQENQCGALQQVASTLCEEVQMISLLEPTEQTPDDSRGVDAYDAIVFLNFIALNTSGGRRFSEKLVFIDKNLLSPEVQGIVARSLSQVIDYNVNHAQLVFQHYAHKHSSYNSLIAGEDILAREYRWDSFQIKYDEFMRLTQPRSLIAAQSRYATGLADVLLNAYLAMKSLNDYEAVAPEILNTPANNRSVLHIGNQEVAGYELLFNTIFRLRIGWEKLCRLLVQFYGQDPGSGFSIILKRVSGKLGKVLSEEAKPMLESLDNHANTAISNIERLRNDEEHNEGVIVRSLGDREYMASLHARVQAEFKRYQVAIAIGQSLLLPPVAVADNLAT